MFGHEACFSVAQMSAARIGLLSTSALVVCFMACSSPASNACADAKKVVEQCSSAGLSVQFDQGKCESGGDQGHRAAECIVANRDRCECTLACALAGSCSSASVAKPGSEFHADASSGGPGDSSSIFKDVVTSPDSTWPDVSPPPLPDGSPPDGPPVVEGGQTCTPGPIGGFSPTWHPPRPKRSVCANTQISDYYASCHSPTSTQSTCSQFQQNPGNLSCSQCLAPSNPTDATYGPVLLFNGYVLVNVAGCVAIAQNETNPSGCAGALQAERQCGEAACGASCPVTDDASLSMLGTCMSEASAGECHSYTTAADTACGNVTACSGSTFATLFGSIARTMCAP